MSSMRDPTFGTTATGALAVFLFAGLSQIGAQRTQQFRAVLVHGEAVARPFLIEEEASAACLWFFTYNFYSQLESQPKESGVPTVTLSFLTREEWAELKAATLERAHASPWDAAAFHTRVHLALPDGQPHVQYQKPRDAGFVSRMQLHTAAEPYLARHSIPTRRTKDGTPVVRRFSDSELHAAVAALRAAGLDAKPECIVMGG
jgi:hypothetical protein